MDIFHLTMNDLTSLAFGLSSPSRFQHRVDQVLYVEMVLPDGQFVRFGPSTWTPAEGNQLYPQTTSVKGYCIAEDTADLSDESTWSWVDCTDQYGFYDLWFAIRGGGGGSYGVITSIYYQLHDKPGNIQGVYWPETLFRIDPSMSSEDKDTVMIEMIKFVFNFLYNPDKVGVSVDASNSCSAPDSPITLDCYNGAGQAFVDAWDQYFGALETANMISGAVPTPRLEEFSSYAARAAPSHYNGRVQDGPKGEVLFGGDTCNALVIPIDVLKTKFDAFMDLYIPCFFDTIEASFAGTPETACLTQNFTPYFYGGDIQFASDGTDAYPPHRRNGALHMYVLHEDVREQFKKLIWDVEENSKSRMRKIKNQRRNLKKHCLQGKCLRITDGRAQAIAVVVLRAAREAELISTAVAAIAATTVISMATEVTVQEFVSSLLSSLLEFWQQLASSLEL